MNSLKPMLLSSLKSYDKSQFFKDVTAGIIVAIIALPLSIALALASGVGPEAGIFTAIVAGFVISALGGSSVQIAGPTAAFATIVAGIVAHDGMDGLIVATILAGMLSPMQSAVNGQLGHWLQDGNACAVISFASGLVVMFFIIMARKETRQQFAAIPSLIKNRKVPLWNWFAGLCGAMVVFSEGASASALGVATFQTALISALLLSGLLCDRFGIGVDEKKYFTPYRIIGALFAVIATIFVVSPQWHSTSFILLAILPFLAGLLAGWQPAGNAKVAEATGSMLVSIT